MNLVKNILSSGKLILYTSGDSVFQIAAHEDILPVNDLYKICKISREYCNEYNIGRVIARPFIGDKGNFQRTYDRKDFGITPQEKQFLANYLNMEKILWELEKFLIYLVMNFSVIQFTQKVIKMD